MSTKTRERTRDSLDGLRESIARQPTIQHDTGVGILTLRTRHGLFSARAIDAGTALLLRELASVPAQPRVLDLGCGYGAIGLTLASRWPTATVTLVDTDVRAVEAARENIESNRLTNAQAVLSPGLRDVEVGPLDLIVSNLPAQAGNDALDEILLEAHDHLVDGGTLVVVVVNGLRRAVQRRLELIFGDANKAHQGLRHTVLEAARSDRSGARPAQSVESVQPVESVRGVERGQSVT